MGRNMFVVSFDSFRLLTTTTIQIPLGNLYMEFLRQPNIPYSGIFSIFLLAR